MSTNPAVLRVGVVADTHGHLDARLLDAFAGVDAILHAGDVGSALVLDGLRRLAPTYAVCGNNDEQLACLGLPQTLDVELAGVAVHVVHQVPNAAPQPHTRVVVYGHSHKQTLERRDGRLFLNPGAAGRRGFHRLQTAALLSVRGGEVEVHLLELGSRLKTGAMSS